MIEWINDRLTVCIVSAAEKAADNDSYIVPSTS